MIINSGAGMLSPTVRTEQKAAAPQAAPQIAPKGGFETLVDSAIDITFFAANELVEMGKNDPALALRYGATTISNKLLEGTGPAVREGFGAAIIPTIRLSLLGANAYRLSSTFKDPRSNLLEKGLDVARVATDLVGLAGSVLKYVMPAKAALGDTLVGFSYAADSVSHSARLVTHGADRSLIWKKALAERRAAKKIAEQPVPQAEVIAPVPTATAPTFLMAR